MCTFVHVCVYMFYIAANSETKHTISWGERRKPEREREREREQSGAERERAEKVERKRGSRRDLERERELDRLGNSGFCLESHSHIHSVTHTHIHRYTHTQYFVKVLRDNEK